MVVGEGLLVADGLELLVGLDRARVDAPRQLGEVPAVRRPESRRRGCPRGRSAMSPTVRTPSRSRRSSVAGPTPHSARAGSGWRKPSSSPGAITWTPSPGTGPSTDARGLAASDASLASIFEGATPTEHVSPSRASTSARMRCATVGPSPWDRRAPVTSRNASSRLIGSTRGVNDRKMLHYPLADRRVVGVVAGQEHGVGAEPPSPAAGHGREDAVGPGLVAGGGHDAPAPGAAHDHRLTPQLRPAQQLDRHEEGVHVDVEDRPARPRRRGSGVRLVAPGRVRWTAGHLRLTVAVRGSSPATQ